MKTILLLGALLAASAAAMPASTQPAATRTVRYADLDLLAMNPHLRRDIGADNLRDAGFGAGDIWRK